MYGKNTLSQAHLETEKLILDPAYSAEKPFPPPVKGDASGSWLFFPYDCEAFLLEQMVREKEEAKLKVGYTKFRRIPEREAVFSASFEKGEKIVFRATGNMEVFLQGKKLLEKASSTSSEMISLILPEAGELAIKVSSPDIRREIPALFVQEKEERWRISSSLTGEKILPAKKEPLNDFSPPNKIKQPVIKIVPEKTPENIFDAGRELFAYVNISCRDQETFPQMYVGESLAEMRNRNVEDEEQTRELIKIEAGKYRSRVLLAFRYIQIENAEDVEITLDAEFHPVCYRGAFSLAGEDLFNRIWLQSCYTLRLCMKNFLLDGIKRDRLPWAGDLAVSLLGNAFSFAEKNIVKDTLCVLGAVSVKEAHINTIIDYTLWYLINHEYFQLYYGDEEFLIQEYPRIRETLEILLASREENGFLKVEKGKVWLFIDWVDGEKFTALQVIFFRALRSGAFLAKLAGEAHFAEKLEKEAQKLACRIKQLAFDEEKGLFTSAPGKKEYTRHPNLLAVDFSLVTGQEAEKIAQYLMGKELPKVGTPYMSVFEAMAVAKGCGHREALDRIREIWGGMLENGATSFWEGYDPDHKGEEHYVFYDRPFGKSLCHAWGAGPAFLLPQMLLGIEAVSCAWKTFKLSPVPGITLKAAIPTPYGEIYVEVVDGEVIFLKTPVECKRVL